MHVTAQSIGMAGSQRESLSALLLIVNLFVARLRSSLLIDSSCFNAEVLHHYLDVFLLLPVPHTSAH